MPEENYKFKPTPEVRSFGDNLGMLLSMAMNPADGALYYVGFGHNNLSQVRRIKSFGEPFVSLGENLTRLRIVALPAPQTAQAE